jgi:carboxymethylenebutenolidase
MERKKASDFDPELLNLLDRYVHGGISRREFLDGAAKFAIGGLTVTALWDMLRPNYALAQQVAKDDKRIRAEYAMYPSPKGNSSNGTMRGLLARPATGDKFPVVVVIHENRGLNPYIEDVVRRLATAGFMTFGPDAIWPLGGYPNVDKYGADADDKAREMQGKLDREKITEDFVAAAEFLLNHPQSTGKLGAVGLLRRRSGQQAGCPVATACGRGSLLRQRTGCRGRAKDQGRSAASICRAGSQHQRQMARLRSRPQGEWRQVRGVCVSQNESRLP